MPAKPQANRGASGLRKRKRRKEIIDAAARVFAERGYLGTSTQNIADLLGMRQASLYYYFDSKEAALEEVCALGVAGFVETAQKILVSGGSAEDRLRALLCAHITPLADRADYVQTFLNERKWLPTESRRHVGRMSRELESIFEQVISEGIHNGEFRSDLDPRLTTLGLLGMMNAVALWRAKETMSLNTIAQTLAELAVKGTESPVAWRNQQTTESDV